MRMLVRTWNLFHGNTVPPGRKAYLREMVDLITADKPDIVCLQEIPAWALGSIGGWSGMQAVTTRTMRAKLGPFPIGSPLGRAFTAPHHGKFRSAFSGQGNVILLPKTAQIRKVKGITLNTNVFCEEQGAKLELSPKMMTWWEQERRVCQVVQYEFADRSRFLVANLHATSCPQNFHLPDAELRRALQFVERAAELEESLIVAGDFNITSAQSESIQTLMTAPPESRWTAVGPQIDHVLLRRAVAESVRVWPDAEREFAGRLLSDHAPVEVEFVPAPKL
jgi:endonuclease/exonuclease/phosphatase family metal-dependent hydrolase